jgi:hypothetical protein
MYFLTIWPRNSRSMHNTCEAFVGLVETHQALSRESLAVLAEKKVLKEEHHWSERYNVGSQFGAMVDSPARKTACATSRAFGRAASATERAIS